ncbi:alpha/beta fold hydrolase [Verticiella sediminum]|uniref:Alpha/beta fold hydrolase n=1 Tax=Verticiella sediminum TaxID=1247510 RepID=A0A556B0W1_9BURK|nr:alpha/beta fold hydrolase [Verticiella sediminum]TSH98838.1 alpha/beta fold hydrolase [Verticiella sediminum]
MSTARPSCTAEGPAVFAAEAHVEDFRLADGTAVTLRLAYTRCGPCDAPAYLLLHGYAGSHHALAPCDDAADAGWASAWVGPGRVLDTDRAQVITVNLPGSAYGSGWEGAQDSHASVRGMAQGIDVLLERLGIPRLAGAIGYSFGGYVAQQLKADFPQRVDRVLGLCTATRGRGAPEELAALRALADADRRAEFRHAVLMRSGLCEWAADQGEAALARELRNIRRWAGQFSAQALWRLRAAAIGFGLAHCPADTHLLYASSDALFPPPDPLPAHASVVVTRYGHQALLYDPGPWLAPIRAWLAASSR